MENKEEEFKFVDHSDYTKVLQKFCREHNHGTINVTPHKTNKDYNHHITDEFNEVKHPIEKTEPCVIVNNTPHETEEKDDLDRAIELIRKTEEPKLSCRNITMEE